jgi:hypothetical protein
MGDQLQQIVSRPDQGAVVAHPSTLADIERIRNYRFQRFSRAFHTRQVGGIGCSGDATTRFGSVQRRYPAVRARRLGRVSTPRPPLPPPCRPLIG